MAGQRDASDAVDAKVLALLAEHPDEELAYNHWLTEALFTFQGSVEEARLPYEYYERKGDGVGMLRALEVAYNRQTSLGRFDQGIELLDRATALAVAIGRPDRAVGFSAWASHFLVESPLPVPEALDRCLGYLDLAGDDRASRVMLLLAVGKLEAYARRSRYVATSLRRGEGHHR